MSGYVDIYQPEPVSYHICPLEGELQTGRCGSIKMCNDCGRYLVLRYFSDKYGKWKKVRWYHFNQNRRIRDATQ